MFRMFRLSFLHSISKAKARKSPWRPVFHIQPRPSPEPFFPARGPNREEGREVQRQKANRKSVFSGPACSLFSSTYPKHWKGCLAESQLTRKDTISFLPSHALEWHVARGPNGKAPNKKAILAHGTSGFGTGTVLAELCHHLGNATANSGGTSSGSFTTLSHPSCYLGRGLIASNDFVSTAMAKSSVILPWPGTAQVLGKRWSL